MADIKREDFFDDDVLMAPIILKKNMEEAMVTLRQFIETTKLHSKTIGDTKSTTKLKEETAKLTLEQKELLKIQAKIAQEVAKDNEAYRAQEKQLKDLKQALKEKNQMSEAEAKTITAQIASIEKLGQALNINRQAYARLTTEEQRNTKAGKELLAIIQKQDKEFKELRVSMGQAQDNVGNYTSAMQGLDGVIGGTISRVQMLGKNLLALFANPVILGIAVVIALVAALASSVKTFYSSTGEGEDELARQQAVWKQFFNVVKKGWSDLGKSVTEFFGTDISDIAINTLLTTLEASMPWFYFVIEKIRKGFNDTKQAAKDLADAIDDIQTRQARNIIDKSEMELEYADLIYKSVQKNLYTEEERLAFRKEANELKEKELKLEQKIAEDNAKALLTEIGLAHLLTKDQIDRIDFRRDYNELDKEFTGDEMKRLAEAYAAVKDLQTNFLSEERKNKAAIDQLQEEIRQRDVKKAEEAAMEKYEIAKKEKDRMIGVIQQEVIEGRKLKIDGDREIANIEKTFSDDLIQAQIDGLKKLWGYEKLTAEERAEIDKKLYQLKLDLAKAYYDQVEILKEVEVKPFDWKKALQPYQQLANSVGQIFQQVFDNRLAQIDAEQKAIEKSTDRQIQLAGDNEQAQTAIQDRYEKKKAELDKKRIKEQRRAAIFEKSLAGVNAAINVAVAATNQGSKGDPYTALARVAAIVAALTPFVLSITKKDIPQYAEGTLDHPGGLAVVGDGGGRELVETPRGQMFFTPGKPTLMDLPEGAKVFSHDSEETLSALALGSLSLPIVHKQSNNDREIKKLGSKLDQIKSAIENKATPDHARIGNDIYGVKKYNDGSKKFIRNRSVY